MSFRKSHPASGARPGTLAIPPGSPPPRVIVTRYDAAGVDTAALAAREALPATWPEDRVTWVDVQGLGDEAVLRRIGDRFGLTPLALEDAINVPQRAKSEIYPDYHLIVSRVPILRPEGGLETPQVCFVVGRRALLTFQERRFGLFDPVRERLAAGIGPIRDSGPDYLAYAMVDTMVDRYYPVAESLSTRLDDLEEAMADDPGAEMLSTLRSIRSELVVLRRVGWPQREMVNTLLREPSPFVTPAVQGYLRDTHDHISQIVELVDSSRELATALSDEFLSAVGHRSNEIMKVLTLMASVFIPLTFIAGIYGMNFEYMPELRQRFGYFLALGMMIVVAAAMIVYFWRRGWIGRGPRRR